MKDKFLWKEGEIKFYKSDVKITPEQYEHAEKVLNDVIRRFKENVTSI